ncbi:hypothetical protein, partial [Pseudomonas sp. NPDC099000]|uniref:hypothetical protein n=1 Tax=Pseudomonas sp. NPDC099000 TaxID=3364488 RepID=UPI00383A8B9D
MIEDHQIGLFGMDQVAKFLDLAAANQEFGGWPMTRHVKKRNGLGAGRIRLLVIMMVLLGMILVLCLDVFVVLLI